MRTINILLPVLSVLLTGSAFAQSRPSLPLGMPPSPPIHAQCPKFDSYYEQAICSGICGKAGGSWVVLNLPKYGEDGEVAESGEGRCDF